MTDWDPVVAFTIAGCPVPWARTGRAGPSGHVFTPRKVRDWEAGIAAIGRHHMAQAGRGIIVGPVRMQYGFWMPDKRRLDFDNLVKLVNDALNRVCYEDDSQISSFMGGKYLDRDRPRTVIRVFEARPPERPLFP